MLCFLHTLALVHAHINTRTHPRDHGRTTPSDILMFGSSGEFRSFLGMRRLNNVNNKHRHKNKSKAIMLQTSMRNDA